ncbi:hypothetical protein MJM99_29505, partial [Salmonella enterica subsp. enterica serovar Kentucky]|nr:hypothetical protein [Salmonella enterica subsp. enterica serovar Kentucky]
MSKKPLLTIAIPTYNRSSCLARLLDSIIQQENYCHDELEMGPQDKVLIVSNGAYGARMVEMAGLMGIAHHAYDCGEVARPDV